MPDNLEEKSPSEALSNDEIQALFDELKSMNIDEEPELTDEDNMNISEIGELSPEIDEAVEQLLKSEEIPEDISDLDRQLMEALEFEKGISEDNFFNEPEMDFINDVAIYDTEDRSESLMEETLVPEVPAEDSFEGESLDQLEETEEKPQKKTPRIFQKAETVPVKRLYIAAAALGVIICALGISAFVLLSKLETAQHDYFKITMPRYSSNDSNFIYRNDIFQFGGQEFKLTKILIDSAATVLYFDGYFDLSAVNISVWDDLGAEYHRDLGYVPPNELKDMFPTTVVRFLPFGENTKSFTIKIEEPEKNQEFELTYNFQSKLSFPPILYTNKKISETRESGTPRIIIENAYFSSTGSVAEFSINWAGENHSLQLGQDAHNESINLTQSGQQVMQRFTVPDRYDFPNDRTTLVRADFEPVRGLDSELNFTFKNLFKVYQMNIQTPPGELLMNRSNKYREYKLDNYRLNLERFFYNSDKAVLVFHVQDTTIPNPNPVPEEPEEPYYNRIEGQLDVVMEVTTTEGERWSIKGDIRSGPIGSDVIFQLPDGEESAKKMLSNTILLNINSALIKMEDITVAIDPKADGLGAEMPGVEAAKETITGFFASRLGYKTGEVEIGAVQGFSREVLSDRRLMTHYEAGTGENMNFSVQVIALSLMDNSMNCVVKEMLRDKSDGTTKTLTHKVKALGGSEGWVIVEDEILN